MWTCLLLLLLATVVSKMAKISTYTVVTPTATDKVIGTDDVGGTNATQNFTVGSIAGLADLQSVLNAGNSATEDISLTGNLSVTGTVADSSGDVGTNGQVLTSTAAGTNWSNTVTDLTVSGTLTATNVSQLATSNVSFVKMNNLGASSSVVLLAPGAGNYIQIVSATFKLDFNTTAYSFSTDLTLGTTTADQFVLPFGVVNSSSDAVAAFLPASGATAGVLGENEPLILGTSTNPSPTTGDSPVVLEILYRIITV